MSIRVSILAVLLSAPAVYAVTIHVPADQATIQAGIDAADAGDTVIVSCGNYFEHDIEMKPGVALLSESLTPDCVSIDAQSLGRVMSLSDAGTSTVIRGFTFMGGQVENSELGGGLHIENSSIEVLDCRFTSNYAGAGGGMHAGSCTGLIQDCEFLANSAGGTGAGLHLEHGDGIILSRCSFIGNQVDQDGGGACILYSDILIEECLFADNEAGIWGGGLELTGDTGGPVMRACTIVNNAAGWAGGGLFSADHCAFDIENTIIAFNRESSGIYVHDDAAYLNFACCDVYGNVDGDYGGEIPDLEGLYGNISSHPLFCDPVAGDFTLALGSPCLPENNDCGVRMGAFGLGCENATSVPIGGGSEESTWSRVKNLF